jgi:hypothetical protein
MVSARRNFYHSQNIIYTTHPVIMLLYVKVPVRGHFNGPMPMPGGTPSPAMGQHTSQSGALKDVDHIRTNFPETWLWINATTG